MTLASFPGELQDELLSTIASALHQTGRRARLTATLTQFLARITRKILFRGAHVGIFSVQLFRQGHGSISSSGKDMRRKRLEQVS